MTWTMTGLWRRGELARVATAILMLTAVSGPALGQRGAGTGGIRVNRLDYPKAMKSGDSAIVEIEIESLDTSRTVDGLLLRQSISPEVEPVQSFPILRVDNSTTPPSIAVDAGVTSAPSSTVLPHGVPSVSLAARSTDVGVARILDSDGTRGRFRFGIRAPETTGSTTLAQMLFITDPESMKSGRRAAALRMTIQVSPK